MAAERFEDVVAARTRAAAQILASPEMLEAYLASGGAEGDLTAIRDHGQRAEALNLAQTQAQGTGEAATLKLLEELASVQREYVLIMSALRAERGAQVEAGAPSELVQQIDNILDDEAQVSVNVTALADGTTKKTRKSSKAQEATRAEIERDMNSLIELTGAHAGLAARRIDLARMTQLRDRARALTGKLATRTEKKGAAKGATKAEREAVRQQNARWGASYRTLALAAVSNAGIKQLLQDAVDR